MMMMMMMMMIMMIILTGHGSIIQLVLSAFCPPLLESFNYCCHSRVSERGRVRVRPAVEFQEECVYVCVCVRACVRACVCARACVSVFVYRTCEHRIMCVLIDSFTPQVIEPCREVRFRSSPYFSHLLPFLNLSSYPSIPFNFPFSPALPAKRDRVLLIPSSPLQFKRRRKRDTSEQSLQDLNLESTGFRFLCLNCMRLCWLSCCLLLPLPTL